MSIASMERIKTPRFTNAPGLDVDGDRSLCPCYWLTVHQLRLKIGWAIHRYTLHLSFKTSTQPESSFKVEQTLKQETASLPHHSAWHLTWQTENLFQRCFYTAPMYTDAVVPRPVPYSTRLKGTSTRRYDCCWKDMVQKLMFEWLEKVVLYTTRLLGRGT